MTVIPSQYDIEIDERNGLLRVPASDADDDVSLTPKSAAVQVSSTTARWRGRKAVTTDDDGAASESLAATGSQLHAASSATMLLDDSAVAFPTAESDEKQTRTPRQGFLFPALMNWGSAKSPSKKLSRVHAGSVVTPQREAVEREEQEMEMEKKPQPFLAHAGSAQSLSQRSIARLPSSPSRLLPPTSVDRVPSLEDDGRVDDPSGPIDMENYMFSVNPAFARETAHHQRFHAARKLHYLRHELFVDLGLTKVRTMEFWLLLVILVFALWLRVYLHYLAQYIFLKARRVPVFYFEPQWTTCVVKYTWRTIATHVEIGVIASGVLGNVCFFGGLALTAALAQEHIGELPSLGSKFIVCVGLATVLDPWLVVIVDLANRQFNCASRANCDGANWSTRACRCVEGDAFKLFYRFESAEGSGLVGVALTAILYTALTCLSLLAFYMYLLHVHMNGRMLDVYRRIHAQETELFLPHDCEVGLQELKGVCAQAARWRGPQGAQRKVFVHEYVLRDPLDAAFEEKSTHIAVYTIALDGRRELYRHFLKSHDGAIVGLLGEVGAAADGSWQRNAAPGLASLALIHDILQDQQRHAALLDEASSADVARLFDGL
ncbi:hypothetical protein ATCC90586_006437 [Pythium insidiosum]|nr:hypothetical protein ATCC90586_006437 [Pythium insidiosum]